MTDLTCTACGSAPGEMRLVDLEAEQPLTGERPGLVTVLGRTVPARYAFEPRCQACWAAYRESRDAGRQGPRGREESR